MPVPANVTSTNDLEVGPPPTNTGDSCSLPGGDTDPEILVDMHDARVLLQRALNLFTVLGDPEIYEKITKRERALMTNLAGQIKPYLDETSGDWDFAEGD